MRMPAAARVPMVVFMNLSWSWGGRRRLGSAHAEGRPVCVFVSASHVAQPSGSMHDPLPARRVVVASIVVSSSPGPMERRSAPARTAPWSFVPALSRRGRCRAPRRYGSWSASSSRSSCQPLGSMRTPTPARVDVLVFIGSSSWRGVVSRPDRSGCRRPPASPCSRSSGSLPCGWRPARAAGAGASRAAVRVQAVAFARADPGADCHRSSAVGVDHASGTRPERGLGRHRGLLSRWGRCSCRLRRGPWCGSSSPLPQPLGSIPWPSPARTSARVVIASSRSAVGVDSGTLPGMDRGLGRHPRVSSAVGVDHPPAVAAAGVELAAVAGVYGRGGAHASSPEGGAGAQGRGPPLGSSWVPSPAWTAVRIVIGVPFVRGRRRAGRSRFPRRP